MSFPPNPGDIHSSKALLNKYVSKTSESQGYQYDFNSNMHYNEDKGVTRDEPHGGLYGIASNVYPGAELACSAFRLL